MSKVVLENITKRFKQVAALRQVSFTVELGEFFVLLGPTGAGKTTTLRVISGLEKQDEGHVLFDDQPMDDVSPAERDTAIVFQEYSLYPTMSVYENLAFPLRSPLRNLAKDDIDRQVRSVAETLKISHLLERKTARLSGGEVQRVSIGRAIVRSPRVFLMDEPLSNLDAKMREVLRVELQHLQRQQGITTIFVTHDQIEALTLADRIGVLNKGRIIQIGTPVEIYDQPGTTFVAQLIGTPRITLAPAEREDGTIRLPGSDIMFPVPQELSASLSENFQFGIRAEDVRIDPQGEFEGQIVLTEPLGTITNIHIQSGNQKLISTLGGLSEFRIGEKVRFRINNLKAHYFDPDGNRIRPA